MNILSLSGTMKIRNGNKLRSDQTADPSKYPQGNFKDKPCKRCKVDFSPKAPSQLYCSQDCIDDANTDKYYKASYGVDLITVREMLVAQGGVCAICKTEGFKMLDGHHSGLNLDHCHETGNVRGLLCHNCNRGLGLFKDNTTSLENAINYLRNNDPR